MQEVEAALANVPVADSGRVAEIKQAMAEGRFQVDASKVADGLIESVQADDRLASAQGVSGSDALPPIAEPPRRGSRAAARLPRAA
jgi:hypothetical protein